jgi:hypothetical protein
MPIDDEVKKKLLEQIEASGFPLELRVTDTLIETGYTVFNNIRFNDTAGVGETDIIATRLCSESPKVHVDLIIECKRSRAKPWVFFRHVWESREKHKAAEVVHSMRFEDYSLFMPGDPSAPFRRMHYNGRCPFSKVHFEAHKKDAGKDIFKATHGTLRAADSYRAWLQNQFRDDEGTVRLLLPTVIFEGDLICATRQNTSFDLQEVEHVLYRTTRLPGDYWNPAGYVAEALVDIVQVDYLTQFLAVVETDGTLLSEHVRGVEPHRRH